MSLTQLFFNEGNRIGEIELDVIISESATATATITQNPVENGADVNDHMIIQPMTFSMSGIVSDTPVKFLGGIYNGGPNTGNDQSRTAWQALLDLHASKSPFTLEQGLKSYDNVVIQSLSVNQDKSNSRAIVFNASLKELIIVGVEEITADQFIDEQTKAGMQPSSDRGQVTP